MEPLCNSTEYIGAHGCDSASNTHACNAGTCIIVSPFYGNACPIDRLHVPVNKPNQKKDVIFEHLHYVQTE